VDGGKNVIRNPNELLIRGTAKTTSIIFARISYIHTYHSRFIPGGVAEVSQIFLRDTHVLPKLAMRNTADVTGGKPIAVLLQSISGVSAFNPLVAFYDIHRRKREIFFYFVPILKLF
jgi:hypothetical protein